MMKFHHNFFLLLLAAELFSCKGTFQFSPNQIILKDTEKNLTAKNIERIKLLAATDTVRFIVASDTHQWLDETADFVKSANAQRSISFVIHLGDLSSTGIAQEYKWFYEIMSGLNVPYLTAAGETDLMDKGAVYHEMFGMEDYSFEIANAKFIIINTNSSVNNNDGLVPNVSWLKSQLSNNTDNKATIVLVHTPPFDKNFNKNMEKQYVELLRADSNFKISIYGHQHAFNESTPYNDGVKYIVTTSMKQKEYLIISVYKNGYHVNTISF